MTMNLKSIAALALAEDAAANQGGAVPSAPSNPDFESKHPRGNSANKGQFRKSEKTLAKLDEADAIPENGEPPLKVRDISGEHDVLRLADLIKGKSEDELRRFLRDNKDSYVRLYHGTGADVSEGLKRTSSKNKRTPNSTHGFVYLAADPSVARRYGEFGYPGKSVSVYAVDVKVRDLLPDKDSIFLARRDSGMDVSDDLASSLFNTGNARVRRDIMPYEMHQLHPKSEPSSIPNGENAQAKQSPAAEYAAVEAKYKGTPEWMKAPNGEPTNLTEKQWVQVRTPSFRAWFGDWENDPENASKVLDSNGEPMVVYHGSPNDFNEFTGGKENNSSWFAENFSYAAEFTRDKGMQGVRHFFLNVRHPFNMRTGDNVVDGYAEISETRHDGGEASPQEIAKIAGLLGTSTEDIKTRFSNCQIWVITQSREFADHLANQGYDGIEFTEFGENTWGTFQPSQIKSATSNSGSFSPDKESILDSAPVFNPAAFLTYLAGKKKE